MTIRNWSTGLNGLAESGITSPTSSAISPATYHSPTWPSMASASTSTSTSTPAPYELLVKETDFACEIPNDADIYSPLLHFFNSVDGHDKRSQIRKQNARKCLEQGLPHPDVLGGKRPEDDPIQRMHMKGKRKLLRAEGSLKRAREDVDEPDAAFEKAARKKARYEQQKADPSSSSSGKRKRGDEDLDGEDEGLGYSSSDDMPDVSEGPKILSEQEYITRQKTAKTSRSRSRRSTRHIKGILRKDVPVNAIYESDAPYTDYMIRRTGNKLVLMGIRYGKPSSSKEVMPSSNASRKSRQKRRRTSLELDSDHLWESMMMQAGTPRTDQPVRTRGQSDDGGYQPVAGIPISTSPPTSMRVLNWIGSFLRWTVAPL